MTMLDILSIHLLDARSGEKWAGLPAGINTKLITGDAHPAKDHESLRWLESMFKPSFKRRSEGFGLGCSSAVLLEMLPLLLLQL